MSNAFRVCMFASLRECLQLIRHPWVLADGSRYYNDSYNFMVYSGTGSQWGSHMLNIGVRLPAACCLS
eukprot:COSAG06_NODE_32297_length_508_cov_1.374083_2_plen_67_part_01